MKKPSLLLSMLLLLIFAQPATAQDFIEGFNGFSQKKPAYITLEDGTELVGRVKGAKWKKGLMHILKFVPEGSEEKEEISVEDIAFLYAAPSGFEKMLNTVNNATTINRWDRDLDADYLKEGYIYFEQVTAMVGKKKRTVLMQLINPHFSGKIRVYNDPISQETGGIGIAGMQVTGGYDKSFYVRKGDGEGSKLMKKKFKKLFDNYFGDCPEMAREITRPDWKEFATYVATYNSECGEK